MHCQIVIQIHMPNHSIPGSGMLRTHSLAKNSMKPMYYSILNHQLQNMNFINQSCDHAQKFIVTIVQVPLMMIVISQKCPDTRLVDY